MIAVINTEITVINKIPLILEGKGYFILVIDQY